MKKAIVGCIIGLAIVFCMVCSKSSFATTHFTAVDSPECRTDFHKRACENTSQLFELEHPDAWDSARENRESRFHWYGEKNVVQEKVVRMILEGVRFDFDKSNIRESAIPKLDRNVEKLKQMKYKRINVVGYTDSKGTEEYNQKLSERRAQSVKDYLVKSGIASDRITVEGRGESGEVAPNKTPSGQDNPEGRAENRRAIELQIWTE